MVKKYIKFIEKSPHKERFLDVIEDIYQNDLNTYDLKKLSGSQNIRRIRVWDVRFIFKKWVHWNTILRVTNRWDAY